MGTQFNDWADESGYEVLHKPGDHSFSITVSFGLEDTNGVMVCNVPGVGGHIEIMSAKSFKEEEVTERMKNSNMYYFVPSASFRSGDQVIGIGNFLGKTVTEWIAGENDLWKLDDKGEVMTAGMTLRTVLRMVAKALTCHHKKKKPLGLSCEKMYVEGKKFKLSEPSTSPDDFTGVVNDLKEFKKLVNLAGAAHKNDPSLILFNALFPLDRDYERKSMDELVLVSFITCHAPLLWTFRERYKFANAYDVMRKLFKADFDNEIKLQDGMYRVVDWWRAIPTNPADPLRRLYCLFKRSYGMKRNHLLLSYIGYCYHHYYEQLNASYYDTLDEDLLKRFPCAFLKTYGQVYVKLNVLHNLRPLPLTLSTLVEILKGQGLDYSMDI